MSENKNNDIPMIPKHQHQAEMMHMSRAVKIIAMVAISAFVAMVIMAYVFVTGYTSRTKDILNTINNLRVYTVEEHIDGQKTP
jgi:Mn2+/Fe2+ NRAMP family transporter